MRLVQILVWMLVLYGSYDFMHHLLSKSEGLPAAGEGTSAQWESLFGYDQADVRPLTQWWIGGLCIASLYALRQISKWILPKTSDIAKKIRHENKTTSISPRKRESFLTCRVSDTTVNTFTDETYDIPGQLSTAQLQVLLEELKYSVDEKFEEIESWISSNEQEYKIWLKRLERVETELSYIRHQIFILMSSNAKLGSSFSIGEVSDAREHVETLKDLSTILAQVKKQFNEDEEAKTKKRKGSGDYKMKELKSSSSPTDLEEAETQKDYNIKEDKKDGDEMLDLERLEANTREILGAIKEEKEERNRLKEELSRQPRKTESVESDIHTASSGNKDEYNSTNHSEKDDSYKYDRFDKVSNRGSPLNETKSKSRSLSPPLTRKRDDAGDNPSSRRSSRSPDSNKASYQDNYLEHKGINDESSDSTNLFNLRHTPFDALELEGDAIKEILPRSSSPKRSVRFAQEQRDVSPSKTPTWLGIEREPLTVKSNEIKGGSDSKVAATYLEVRSNKESASCPTVEDKRPSRRTVLEKELTRLERRASPSPPRTRQSRRSNVRSKVADYIRGNKSL